MVELATWANIAEIFGAVMVVGALGFAGYQLRMARNRRAEIASLAVLEGFLRDPGFQESIRIVMGLPDGWTEDSKYMTDDVLLRHVDRLHNMFDISGYLVYERALRLEHIVNIEGNLLMASWRKLEPFARKERLRQAREGPFEWTEWLVDRLRENGGDRPRDGAFKAHRDWRP